MKEAMFYKLLDKDKKIVQCSLCPHHCVIEENALGRCGVRKNISGALYSLSYDKVCSRSVDPVEKKPLFHLLPGSKTMSIATPGCNMSCEFCQNWEISQVDDKDSLGLVGESISPDEIVQDAIDAGCDSIAFTYTEPTIFFELAYDTCVLAKKRGLKTIFVSNGFIDPAAIDKISGYLDAINIDLKGFSDDFYKDICGARLEPILEAIKRYHGKGVFIELTTLIVPGHNDKPKMLEKMADFIASISKDIPWHISRFHPAYKIEGDPTDLDAMHKAIDIGKKKGIKYIYAGNIPGDDTESTFCPHCGKKVIERFAFQIVSNNLDGKKCGHCGEDLNFMV